MNVMHKSPQGIQAAASQVEIGLKAAIVAIAANEPRVLTVRGQGATEGLPAGLYRPALHSSLEAGLRNWVSEQTGIVLGHVEQLYTYHDSEAPPRSPGTPAHVISVGYLALTRCDAAEAEPAGPWRGWYDYLPWEDWRRGRPAVVGEAIEPRLTAWAAGAGQEAAVARPAPWSPAERVRLSFGLDGHPWDEEKVLDRFELLCEAGLLGDAGDGAAARAASAPLGRPLRPGHRRLLASAIARLRGKVKHRPVVFELMADDFTLFELQRAVEAILGNQLHKQNFRRLVESAGLVDDTGELRTHTGGRPAKLFRFRREVLLERPAPSPSAGGD